MPKRMRSVVPFVAGFLLGSMLLIARSGEPGADRARPDTKPRDPAAEATAVRGVPTGPAERPEQKLTEHDVSGMFDPSKPAPLTRALKDQPKEGRITGFDFARDPL